MNRLLTFEGRQPIWLDDLDFLQNSVADEIKKLVEGITDSEDEVIILSGCNVNQVKPNTSITITAGIIAYKGELYRVDAKQYDSNAGGFRIKLREDYDSEGDRTLLESGEEVSCYQLRRAYIATPANYNGKLDSSPVLLDCRRLDDILQERTEKVLYSRIVTNDAGTTARISLTRRRDTYLLSCNFMGADPTFSIGLNDERAMSDLCVPRSVNDSAQQDDPSWAIGEYFGSCVFTYGDSEMPEYAPALVRVKALINEGPVIRTKWTLEIGVESPELAAASGSYVKGGFTMVLNKKIASI